MFQLTEFNTYILIAAIIIFCNIENASSLIKAMKKGVIFNNLTLVEEKVKGTTTKEYLNIKKPIEEHKHPFDEDLVHIRNDRATNMERTVRRILEAVNKHSNYLKKIEAIDNRSQKINLELSKIHGDLSEGFDEIGRQYQVQKQQEYTITNELSSVKHEIKQVHFLLKQKHQLDIERGLHPGTENTCKRKLDRVEYMMNLLTDSVDRILNTVLVVKNKHHNRTNRRAYTSKEYELKEAPQSSLTSLVYEFKRALRERNKMCECTKMGRTSEAYPSDCFEIQSLGFNVTGIYKIKPEDMDPFYVLCDMKANGGGWTVFQNRYDGSQDFYRSWSDYKYGFGNLAGEFWIGLEKLHYITNQKLYELRVEIESNAMEDAYASYNVFSIGSEVEGYRISTIGSYHGNAGDSLLYHSGQKFSTYDADNDEWKEGVCAKEHGGAWWYKECDKSNLNGRYFVKNDDVSRVQGVYWNTFKGPTNYLIRTRMMVRPLPISHMSSKPASNIYTPPVTPSVIPNKFTDLTRKEYHSSPVEPRGHNKQQLRKPNVDNSIPFIPLDDSSDQSYRKWSPSYDDFETNIQRKSLDHT